MIDELDGWHLADPAETAAADPESVRAELSRRVSLLAPVWHEYAACRGSDVGVFFPAKGQRTDAARGICAGCPVVDPCLAEAIDDDALDHGIRAGLSVPERRRLRALRRRGGA